MAFCFFSNLSRMQSWAKLKFGLLCDVSAAFSELQKLHGILILPSLQRYNRLLSTGRSLLLATGAQYASFDICSQILSTREAKVFFIAGLSLNCSLTLLSELDFHLGHETKSFPHFSIIKIMVYTTVPIFKQLSNQTCWCSHFLLSLLFVKLTPKKLQAYATFNEFGYCPRTSQQRIYHLNEQRVRKRSITLPFLMRN